MRRLFGGRNKPPLLRRATAADAPGVAALHAQSFAHPWAPMTVEAMLADRAVTAHVAELRGFAGGIAGFVLARLAADEAEILSVAVAEDHRGAGLARRLMEPTLDALTLKRAARVFLEVEAGNAPAIALYRRLGFETVGTRRGYYRAASGPPRDALTMALDLRRRAPAPPVLLG